MNIPERFKLAGLTVEIKNDESLVKDKGYIGEARYHEQSILLDKQAAPCDSVEQAYHHELVHWILYVMNKDELRNNEEFVDVFGHLLYQAIKTAEYGEV